MERIITQSDIGSGEPFFHIVPIQHTDTCLCTLYSKAFKPVFTSPSSADHNEPKATRSEHACIHGMTCVTKGSLANIATQVSIAYQDLSHLN